MAKAGLHSLTQHLGMELASHGIRVNAIAPAVVRTPIYEGFIPKDEVDGVVSSFDAFHPLGRVGTPEDIAEVVGFVASRPSHVDLDLIVVRPRDQVSGASGSRFNRK